jgi:hypothetical protein
MKAQKFWMAKGPKGLAPYWGLERTRKAMLTKIRSDRHDAAHFRAGLISVVKVTVIPGSVEWP